MMWETCDHCNDVPVNPIRFNGGVFCSMSCFDAARREQQRQSREGSIRAQVARDRAFVLGGLALIVLLGWAVQGGGQQRDEQSEARERLALHGRVSWDSTFSTLERNH